MRFLRSLAAVGLAFSWAAFAVPVGAQTGPTPATTSCQCWCTSTAGATSAGSVGSSAACATTCKEKNEKIVVCSTKASELPANNLRCFKDIDECKLNCEGPVLPNSKPSGYIFDTKYQPPECPSTFRYCYCTGEAYKLAYSIPNPDLSKPPIAEVADLGSYVNTVYVYLLGFSGIVAIVMIMVGGLQYVTSVGGSNISEAKKRIQNAVIGLILLFSAALILQTVNPRLLTLQPPRLPTVKRIELVTAGSNCKILADQGYQIEGYTKGSPEKPCGTKAVVQKDKAGSAIAEGTVCTFKGCAGETSCFISGDKGQCLTCAAVTPVNELGVIPTSNVCSQLGEGMKPTRDEEYPYCFWTRDPSMMLGANSPTLLGMLGTAGATIGGALVAGPIGAGVGLGVGLSTTDLAKFRYGTCAELRVDCANLEKVKLEGQATEQLVCESYNDNNLDARNNIPTDNEMNDLAPGWGDMDMKKLCETDPCKMAKGSARCLFAAEDNECITPILGQGATGDACNDNTNCISGICITVGLNQCAPPGGQLEGAKCDENTDCKSKICNRAGANTCAPEGGSAIGSSCAETPECVTGAYCVLEAQTGPGGRCIVSSETGEACDSDKAFLCANKSCINNKCVGSKASGSVCRQDYECSSGNCAGNVYGATDGNCE